jgi:hypothetical protein
MTEKTSNTCIDLIKHIPDVQVDLFQNISFNGSQNILVLINDVKTQNGLNVIKLIKKTDP